MENNFLAQAIELVSKAIEADNGADYPLALSLYKRSLGKELLILWRKRERERQRQREWDRDVDDELEDSRSGFDRWWCVWEC
jgi:hypothetical protein